MEVEIELTTNELTLYGLPPTAGGGGGGAVDSVNDLTGEVVLDQDDILDGTTYKQYSITEKIKLAGIEELAEVNNISDANAIDLTDGNDTTLHTHDGRYYTETEVNAIISAIRSIPMNYKSGEYFLASRSVGVGYTGGYLHATVSNANNKVKVQPLLIDHIVTVTDLAIYLVAGNTGGFFRIGIYSDNNGEPGNVLCDTGTASTSTPGLITFNLSTPLTLTPGQYWIGIVAQNLNLGSASPSFSACSHSTAIANEPVPAPNNNGITSKVYSAPSGALTANPTLSFISQSNLTATPFNIWMKVQ